MPNIEEINGVAGGSVEAVNGVANASIEEINGAALAAAEATPTASGDLEHWWKMNGASTSTEADAGGATTTRALACTDVTIAANGNKAGNQSVKVFDGTSGVGIAQMTATMAQSPMSVSFWLKITGSTNWVTDYPSSTSFAAFGTDAISGAFPREGWKFGIWNSTYGPGRLNYSTGNSNGSYAYSGAEDSGGLNFGEWNHVVGTIYRGEWTGSDTGPGVQRIFINGVEGTRRGGAAGNDHQALGPDKQYSAYTADIADLTTFYMAIGAQPQPTATTPDLGMYAECQISDFRIYSISLSAVQVAAIYNSGNGDWP